MIEPEGSRSPWPYSLKENVSEYGHFQRGEWVWHAKGVIWFGCCFKPDLTTFHSGSTPQSMKKFMTTVVFLTHTPTHIQTYIRTYKQTCFSGLLRLSEVIFRGRENIQQFHSEYSEIHGCTWITIRKKIHWKQHISCNIMQQDWFLHGIKLLSLFQLSIIQFVLTNIWIGCMWKQHNKMTGVGWVEQELYRTWRQSHS